MHSIGKHKPAIVNNIKYVSLTAQTALNTIMMSNDKGRGLTGNALLKTEDVQ